jgi:hypothetical protein
MKVTRLNRGYTLYLSDHEFSLLELMYKQSSLDDLWMKMTTGERRSYSRRVGGGHLLRVDKDRRKEGATFYAVGRSDNPGTG